MSFMSTEHVEPVTAHPASEAAEQTESAIQPVATPTSRQRRAWNWQDALYLGILVLLVIFAARVFTPNFGGEIPGMWWDPLLNTWILSWDTTTLLHAPMHFWQAPLLYPNPNSLTYSENLLGEALIFAPFYLVSHNPVLAYNFTFYITLLLCSINMFIAARYYTQKPLAAFIAALVYTYSPYRISQIDHIHVLAGEWIPLAFLCLDLALQKKKWRHWILFALFYLLQILSSIYYGIFLSYTLLAYVLIRYGRAFLKRLRAEGRPYLQQLFKQAVKPIVALAGAGIILIILLEPYLASLHNGYGRTVMQSGEYSAFIRDFYYTIPFNWLRGVAVAHGETLPLDGEHFLFLGWTTMLLVAAGVILAWRRRDIIMRAYALTGLIVLFFAFGPFLQYSTSNGAPLLPTQPYNYPFLPRIPMPWLIAYFVFPGFQGLRVPARLIGVLLMILALLAAYVVAWLQDNWSAFSLVQPILPKSGNTTTGASPVATMRASKSRRSSWRPLAARVAIVLVLAVLPVALLAEAMPAYIPITLVPTGNAIPAVYKWLATHEGNAPIVELPMSHLDETFKVKQEAWYDYYTIYHSHPIVDGWSGYRPQLTIDVSQPLLSFPSVGSLQTLQKIHVSYVVFHPQLYLQFDSPGVVASLITQMQQSPHLQLIVSFGATLSTGDSVWQVT